MDSVVSYNCIGVRFWPQITMECDNLVWGGQGENTVFGSSGQLSDSWMDVRYATCEVFVQRT